ncbi:MAG: carboxypeptidase regulatory-like domain-containing protein [Ignavibacteriaceae bacterium]
MKKITNLFIYLAIFFFLISVKEYPQMMMQDTLRGHVYVAGNEDAPRIPIPNATVSLHSFTMLGDSTFYSATTDSTGAFEIGGITHRNYVIFCTAPGYSTLVRNEFDLEDQNSSINLYLHDTLSISGGTISGKVRFDESDIPISQAIIEFISLNNSIANVFTTTDTNGFYRAKVPGGQYYVSCSVSMNDTATFFHEYYKNALTIAGAEILNVNGSEPLDEINFDIPRFIAAKHTITFSGNVQSSSSTPVDSATIDILAAGGEEHGERSLIASTKTDISGNFSITLDSLYQLNNSFIVAAHKDGYKIQFYNNQDAFFDATILRAFNDTTFSNLNFSLVHVDTNYKFSISGTVKDTSGMGINNAFVTAFDSATGQSHMAITDTNGNYTIKALAQGSYYVMFFARGYEPQFYPNADEWEKATPVNVSDSVINLNSVLFSDHQSTAFGDVIGDIHSDKGNPLPGVLVTLKDSTGETIGSAVTDANGSYSISGLAQGNYTIIASVSTYSSQNQTTSYNPNSGTTTVSNFTMTQAITAVKNQVSNVPSNFVLDNNYPNPFNPSTIIGFSVPYSTHVTLDIFNVLGQKVAELVNKNLAAGQYTYSFNANRLSSGVYLYRLQTDNFVSVKKMILSK